MTKPVSSASALAPPPVTPHKEKNSVKLITNVILPILSSLVSFVFLHIKAAAILCFAIAAGAIAIYASSTTKSSAEGATPNTTEKTTFAPYAQAPVTIKLKSSDGWLTIKNMMTSAEPVVIETQTIEQMEIIQKHILDKLRDWIIYKITDGRKVTVIIRTDKFDQGMDYGTLLYRMQCVFMGAA